MKKVNSYFCAHESCKSRKGMKRGILFKIMSMLLGIIFPYGILTAQEMVFERLFEDTEPLQLSLRVDLKDYQRTRKKEEYKDARLIIHSADTLSLTVPVRIRARGVFRRGFCRVPPYWLNIRYSGMEVEVLEGIRRIKVVPQCRYNKQYTDYLLKEYMVYRIYNLVTPYSFRVRLARIDYVDTGRDEKVHNCWGFFIEPEQALANRLGGTLEEDDLLAMRTVNPEVMDRLAMFQYMIGNGDYSITGRHNVKIINLGTPGRLGLLPVPYDFDYTGIVNTEYAVPNEGLGISSVRERYFMGPCRNSTVHRRVVEELCLLEKEILDLILTFDYLESDEKIEMVDYIESFFDEIEDDSFIERRILPTCKQAP